MQVELAKVYYIEAAHRVPLAGERSARLHGHSFKIEIRIEGEVDSKPGWLIDYGEISRAFKPIQDRIDHSYLNEVKGLDDPSLSGLAAWLEAGLDPKIPLLKSVQVSVAGANRFETVLEPADTPHDLPARLGFTIEAAQSLPKLPRGHKCRRLHGHSYLIEVGAGDLARIESQLEELYEALDHRCLNDIPGLEDATSERICQWVWDWLSARIDDLAVVVVQETNSARCTYRGE